MKTAKNENHNFFTTVYGSFRLPGALPAVNNLFYPVCRPMGERDGECLYNADRFTAARK